jgi:hypothetical protein
MLVGIFVYSYPEFNLDKAANPMLILLRQRMETALLPAFVSVGQHSSTSHTRCSGEFYESPYQSISQSIHPTAVSPESKVHTVIM